MPIEFVADGIGNPRYLVFTPDDDGPWIARNMHEVINEVRSFDVAHVFLLTPKAQIEAVHFVCTDGDPNFDHWEVIVADGGDLVERAYFDPDDPNNFDAADRLVQVNGFL